jgi:creatinine amidohydrolase
VKNDLSVEVQMQFMRPAQLEAAARKFPVVYVPFGLIEWHGLHMPLGNDALKAHAILVKAAMKHGGVVYPPVYFHNGATPGPGFPPEHLIPVLTHLFDRLKKTGFRVIVAVSGHDVKMQIDMMERALAPVVADGTVAGVALWEMSLSRCADSDTDHAAKWETSNIMFLYPDRVDISALGKEPIVFDMKPPAGIKGLDPREHASAKVGEKNVELASDAIGNKAREMLASLPEGRRGFNLPALAPEHWWMV